jgi:multiple sugar transport system substrate-binding protein
MRTTRRVTSARMRACRPEAVETVVRRRVQLSLAAALVLMAGAACTTSPTSSSSSQGKVVLTVAYGSTWVFMSPSLAVKWWQTVGKEFEQQHPNVTVKWIPIGGNYNDLVNKLSLLYRSPSTSPDVAELPSPNLGGWESSGDLLPIDSYLKTASWYANFPKAVQTEGLYNGKEYYVNHFEATDALMYNIPDFKKAGIPLPWRPKTWADVLAACAKVKAAVPKVSTFFVVGAQASGAEGILLGSGNLLAGSSDPTIFDTSTKKWVVDSRGIRETLSFFHSLAMRGYNPSVSVLLSPLAITNAPAMMAQGKFAIAVAANFWGESYAKLVSAPYFPQASKVLGFAPLPTSNGQSPGIASTLGGWGLAIGAHTAHPDLAWDFINVAQQRVNMIDVSNWGGGVPPDTKYFSDPLYANFAPPFQAEFAKIEPYGQEAPTTIDYNVWAQGFNAATQALQQNPNETVDQAVNTMKTLITNQLGSSLVETRR